MRKYLYNIFLNKGEGLIVRKSVSVYDRGKSPSVLKVKVCRCTFFVEFWFWVGSNSYYYLESC